MIHMNTQLFGIEPYPRSRCSIVGNNYGMLGDHSYTLKRRKDATSVFFDSSHVLDIILDHPYYIQVMGYPVGLWHMLK